MPEGPGSHALMTASPNKQSAVGRGGAHDFNSPLACGAFAIRALVIISQKFQA